MLFKGPRFPHFILYGFILKGKYRKCLIHIIYSVKKLHYIVKPQLSIIQVQDFMLWKLEVIIMCGAESELKKKFNNSHLVELLLFVQ